VFWRFERDLAQKFLHKGIVYTRLVDDITCSAKRDLSADKISWVIQNLHSLTYPLGFTLKRKKETIAHAGDRMISTKLVVNKKLSLPAERRSQIRAAVNSYVGNPITVSKRDFKRVVGQVAYLTQHHPVQGSALRNQLRHARLPSGE